MTTPNHSPPCDGALFLDTDDGRTVYVREDDGTYREVGTLDDERGPGGELVVTLRPKLLAGFECAVHQVPEPAHTKEPPTT